MNIVVCADYGQTSKEAVKEATEFAQQVDGSLQIVHSVQKGIDRTGDGLTKESDDVAFRNSQDLVDEMEQLAQRMGISDVSTEIIQSNRNPVSDVRMYVQDNDSDYVFIGHRDLGEKKEAMFGSFTKDALGQLDAPVVVVS